MNIKKLMIFIGSTAGLVGAIFVVTIWSANIAIEQRQRIKSMQTETEQHFSMLCTRYDFLRAAVLGMYDPETANKILKAPFAARYAAAKNIDQLDHVSDQVAKEAVIFAANQDLYAFESSLAVTERGMITH
jgi:hypothetical protein